MELVRPKRRSPIPARQRADLPLDAVGIPDAADAGTRRRSPVPRPARAANAPSELGPRPRAKAARATAPDRRPRPHPVRPGPGGGHAPPDSEGHPRRPPRAAPPHPPADSFRLGLAPGLRADESFGQLGLPVASGPFELSLSQTEGPAEVGHAGVGPVEVGPAEDGPAEV